MMAIVPPQKTTNNDKSKKIMFTIISFALSIIVTILSNVKLNEDIMTINQQPTFDLSTINLSISLLLGFSSFMVSELIAILYYSISYTSQKLQDDLFMEHYTDYSNLLHEMNMYYYEICNESHGDNDLFVTYAKKEIDKLNNILRKAAKQKEFSIFSDYIINANGVFDAFSQTSDKTLRMTFPIYKEDTEGFYSQADSHFFEVLDRQVSLGVVDNVQVIIILENGEEFLKKSFVKKLLDYYSAKKGFVCKIADLKEFRNVCDINGISSQFIDFGIYGPKMLFVAKQYEPYEGTYYKDESEVLRYSRLFNEVWNSEAITSKNPSNNTNQIPLGDLILKQWSHSEGDNNE